jgi:3-hydroxybutyryl-CoA dehydratase
MRDINMLRTGTELPEIKRVVTQQVINRYAEVSRDFNPIHVNAAFAARTPLGGTVAHGMLSLAYISQMMTESFGHYWISTGKLSVRFKNPARPGDIISIKGKIAKVENINNDVDISCEILCTNQLNEPIVIGETHVRLPA